MTNLVTVDAKAEPLRPRHGTRSSAKPAFGSTVSAQRRAVCLTRRCARSRPMSAARSSEGTMLTAYDVAYAPTASTSSGETSSGLSIAGVASSRPAIGKATRNERTAAPRR